MVVFKSKFKYQNLVLKFIKFFSIHFPTYSPLRKTLTYFCLRILPNCKIKFELENTVKQSWIKTFQIFWRKRGRIAIAGVGKNVAAEGEDEDEHEEEEDLHS